MSVCLSQVGVLLKRLNVWLRKQRHTIDCSFLLLKISAKIKRSYPELRRQMQVGRLPDLCRLSCHSVQRMFSKITTRHQAHKPVKKCNYWGPIFETEWSRGSNCVSVPNFVAIGPTVAEIWWFFSIFQDDRGRYLGFVMCVFRTPTKGIWWSLSLCKIWLESIQ